MPSTLRFTTWLAPGLPIAIFRTIADHIGHTLGLPTDLAVEPKISGPMNPGDDLFSANRTDVGFLCPPPYLWLTERSDPPVRLVPMAPVFDDSRNQGRPVYFSDLVVANDSTMTSVADLAGCRFGYNDPASLSGYHSVLAWLSERDLDPSYFGSFTAVGSHRRSLQRIASGDLDAAAVDANVWRSWEDEHPAAVGSIRSLTAIGPHPVQPMVVRSELDHLVQPIRRAMTDPELVERLAPYGIVAFAPIGHEDYTAMAAKLAAPPGRNHLVRTSRTTDRAGSAR